MSRCVKNALANPVRFLTPHRQNFAFEFERARRDLRLAGLFHLNACDGLLPSLFFQASQDLPVGGGEVPHLRWRSLPCVQLRFAAVADTVCRMLRNGALRQLVK